MLRNEKGFTYPLTFSIILLAAVLLTIHIEFYLSEVRFYKESETILKQEYYLLSSMKQMESILLEENSEYYSGEFTYSDGVVHFHTSQISETVYMTTFNLILGTNSKITGYGYFNTEEGKMFKWIERN